jgi:class III poly(R)-hydroxyalkanoic acid synthase PhaE subunit
MSNNSLFNDDWLKLQQDYWQGLAEMGRKAMGVDDSRSQTNPWQAAMDQWWRAVSPAAPDPARDFMQRMLEQGKSYFGLVEQMTRGLQGADAAKGGWDALTKTFDDMQRAFTGGVGDRDDAMRRMMGFWEMPLDNWQRMMSSLSPMMPGDLLRNMPHDAVKGNFDRMLSAPGLGYSREEQAQYQDLTRRVLDYQRTLQEYAAFFSQLGFKSVQRMREFVQAQAAAGKTIESVRTLYDSWVACCEDVYAEEVATPEYARIHGQLVNADMALKKRMSVMVDENLGALNMPTRSELRTLQDRLQETRRENKQLRHDLDMIKRRLATLPGGSPTPARATASAQAPAARKKPTVRKKTAVKSGS